VTTGLLTRPFCFDCMILQQLPKEATVAFVRLVASVVHNTGYFARKFPKCNRDRVRVFLV